jgi:branched-chain amino acid transport system ATP-binding protein
MPSILEIKNVNKSYGGVQANVNINLEVVRGSITGIIGPNGSGKTTLFHSIVGHHPIDSGSILFNNQEISTLSVEEITRLGLLRTFQQTRIYGNMNCIENLLTSLPSSRHKGFQLLKKFSKQDVKEAEDLLDFVNLHEKRKLQAGSLSFGQQKLLELAMALMNQPQMLLLDEPTGGINPTMINTVMEKLIAVNKQRKITLLVIEHNMRVVMGLAEKIYCLANSKILEQGSPKEIKNNQKVIDAYLGDA